MSDVDENEEEYEDIEQVLFQGPMYGREANLKKNPRLVKAGLMPVKRMFSDALSRRAHTILVEPKGPRLIVRFVIDGIAYAAGAMPGKQGVALVQMVKLLAGMDVQSRTDVQTGGILAEYDDENYRLLIETRPVRGAVERLKVRVQNTKESFIHPGDVGFPDKLRDSIRNMTEEANGIILACGPAESGVTSLSLVALHCMDPYLYAVFNMADLGDHELTNIPDFEGEEGHDLELNLDRIIRKEGDAVYIGEFNDPEQTQLLFDFSDRLCFFGEIAADTPAEAVMKLIDLVGVDKVLTSLKGVVSQKLIRRLCDDCKQAFRPRPQVLKQLGLPPETTVLYRAPSPPSEDDPEAPSVAQLCADCNGIPYHGRVAAYEMFEMTDGMREVIANEEGVKLADIRKQMIKEQQTVFQRDALRLIVEGSTSLEEVKRAFTPPGKGRGKRRPMKRRPRPA